MKKIFLILALLISTFSFAQHFEWAVSANNVDLAYSFSAIDHHGNIIVAGNASRTWKHRGPVEINEGTRTRFTLEQYGSSKQLILSYSEEGKVNWTQSLFNDYSMILGVALDHRGAAKILVEVIAKQPMKGTMYGYLPSLIKNEPIPAGVGVITLDPNGVFVGFQNVLPYSSSKVEVSNFKCLKDGYIITGFSKPGNLSPQIGVAVGAAGGEFLMRLDTMAVPKWAKVLSFKGEKCCSFLPSKPLVSLTPDGTIYLGSTFVKGLDIGSTDHLISTTSKDAVESYVASFAPSGELKWIHFSGPNVAINALVASNKRVYASFRASKANQVFNKDIEGLGNTIVLRLNKSGKIIWGRRYKAGPIWDMVLDSEEQLYVMGSAAVAKDKSNTAVTVLDQDTLSNKTTLFITKVSKKGKVIWAKESYAPWSTEASLMRLYLGPCNHLFLLGELSFPKNVPTAYHDMAIIPDHSAGSTPLILKLNNSMPSKEMLKSSSYVFSKDIAVDPVSSCNLAPGPWSIELLKGTLEQDPKISVDITYDDAVSIEVYSLDGRRLVTLVNGKSLKAGRHVFPLNYSLAKGTYVLVLKGTGTIASKTITKG